MSRRFLIARTLKVLKRLASATLVAVMIGVSNIILEEDRSVNDTRARIEQEMIQSDEEE